VLDEGVADVFVMPDGYVSVKAAPVIAAVLGLVSVMVMFVALLGSIVPGLKLFTAVGDAIAVSVSVAAVPVPALVVDIFPVLFV
jgi:hypothetical protein